MAKLNKEQIIESLKEASLLEINDLIKGIEEAFGVSAAAPVAVAAGPAAVEAKPEAYDVVLVDAGASKIAVIKLYREFTGLGLMEAKTAVEKGNVNIKENVKPDEAEKIKKDFEAIGAKIKLS